MTNEPVDLDEWRNTVAQETTDHRRWRLYELQVQQEALHHRQEELETLLSANSTESWLEAAAKAQYLIEIFADTQEAQEPRRKELIARTLEDLARLSYRERPR